MQPGEFAPHSRPGVADVPSPQLAVRAGEVNEFKNAEGFAGRLGMRLKTPQPALIRHHHLAGFHLADEFRADQIQGAGLAGEDDGLVESSDDQRPEAERVACGNHLVLAHQYQGVRPMHPGERLGQSPAADRRVGPGNQMENNFAVRGRLKDGSRRLQFLPEHPGIDQVSVVGDGDLSPTGLHRQGLGILDIAGSGRRVADVTDGPRSSQLLQVLLAKNLSDQSHPPLDGKWFSQIPGRDDAGALLPPMLKGIETVVGQLCRIGMVVHPEDSAFMFGMIGSLQESFYSEDRRS